ncbi:MAG: hypothetical protein QOI40_3053, partial [Alphaproteobacteria bacterium]|nr:hypothetical protein [Alphaproteobacteria bacterium]
MQRLAFGAAFGVLALFVLAAKPSTAQTTTAQSWPERTVKLIVPLGPG